jgi:hypothetical protein
VPSYPDDFALYFDSAIMLMSYELGILIILIFVAMLELAVSTKISLFRLRIASPAAPVRMGLEASEEAPQAGLIRLELLAGCPCCLVTH